MDTYTGEECLKERSERVKAYNEVAAKVIPKDADEETKKKLQKWVREMMGLSKSDDNKLY